MITKHNGETFCNAKDAVGLFSLTNSMLYSARMAGMPYIVLKKGFIRYPIKRCLAWLDKNRSTLNEEVSNAKTT